MQTFLPYSDYNKSAEVLDFRRLGKQRVEAWMILQILTSKNPNSFWRNHPAVKIWKGYEPSLAAYGAIMCLEWINRGYEDNCLAKIKEICPLEYSIYPYWLGNKKFHESHQSNLIRKNPEYYRPKFPRVPNNLPYYWPLK